jgi:signal transduction histidine kinase
VLPAIILVAGLVCTVLATVQMKRTVERAEAQHFASLVEDRIDAIQDRMETYLALMRGAAGLFAASGDVTGAEFRTYVERLRVGDLYQGIQGVGFSALVPPGQVAAFEAGRQTEQPGFRIRPDTPREVYTAITNLEPATEKNQLAIGYDMFSEPVRRQAMEQARDTGNRAMTGKVALVQDDGRPGLFGILIYLPVYETIGGTLPETVEERRRLLRGWVYSPFRSQDLFTRSTSDRRRTTEIDWEIYDGTAPDPAGLLFRSTAAPLAVDAAYSTARTAQVAGRNWTLRAVSSESFARDSTRTSFPFIAAGGLLTTVLLFGASLAQARAMREAEKAREEIRIANAGLEERVEERTAQLESARSALEALNRNLETRVSIRTADLQEANEEMQRFAYIVSHDLRSPLVNVMGFTSELDVAREELSRFYKRTVDRDPGAGSRDVELAIQQDLPEAIEFIRSSTSKMDRLINAILKLSREGRRVLAPEPIELTGLMRTIAKSLALQIDQAGAEVSVDDLPQITSDRVALEQIFSNLVENAVKYLAPERKGQIKVRGWSEGATIVIDVEDNGRGIDPRDHSRVFDLFRRAGAQDRPGEGIGLAHVRALVRRLGGTITLNSEEGRGSTFRVRLPKTLTRTEGNA